MSDVLYVPRRMGVEGAWEKRCVLLLKYIGWIVDDGHEDGCHGNGMQPCRTCQAEAAMHAYGRTLEEGWDE